jgi:hypothetical protein
MTFAAERPGASAEGGKFEDRIEIQNIRARFPWPDLMANIRSASRSGRYIRAAAIVRKINWARYVERSVRSDRRCDGLGSEPQL